MNCNEAGLLIQMFMDKETDKQREEELFLHLAECSNCRSELRMLRQSQKVFLNSLEEYPERLDESVIDSIKKRERMHKSSIFTRRLPAYYLYAASISAILILALYFFRIQDYDQQRELDMNKYNLMLTREYEQGEYINLLMDQLPGIKVRAGAENPGIVKRGM